MPKSIAFLFSVDVYIIDWLVTGISKMAFTNWQQQSDSATLSGYSRSDNL
jgi:hypothetical protein